jgi:hypothetical protein
LKQQFVSLQCPKRAWLARRSLSQHTVHVQETKDEEGGGVVDQLSGIAVEAVTSPSSLVNNENIVKLSTVLTKTIGGGATCATLWSIALL